MKVGMQKWSTRTALAVVLLGALGGAATAAVRIEGKVQAGGGPVANSTVTLWADSAGEPTQLAQARTGDDGSFALNADATPGPGESLFVVAKGGVASVNKGAGDNPALAFLAVLGGEPPAVRGPALSLSIAAGNVPNFVDLQTGGWGGPIQDPLNSGQTPTMANFATLADALAGCATRVTPIACEMLFRRRSRRRGTRPRIR
jgi:hypothetical protein